MADKDKIPSGSFVEGLKMGWPDVTNDIAVKLYNDLLKTHSGVENMDPLELGKLAASAKDLVPAREQPGPTPDIDTRERSAFAGTDMATRNPANPHAELMNQFDPEAIKRAYARQAEMFGSSLPSRTTGAWFGAQGSQGGQAAADYQKSLDTQRDLQTTGLQKALQDSATSGITGANTLQTSFKTAGEDQVARGKGLQDIIQSGQKTQSGGMDLEVKKKMMDPNSAMSKLARASAIRQWQAVNNNEYPDKATLDEFNKMNFMELGPVAEPNILKMWKEVSAGRTAEAGADIDQATAGSMVSGLQKPGMSVNQSKPAQRALAGNIPAVGGDYDLSKLSNEERRLLSMESARANQTPNAQAALAARNTTSGPQLTGPMAERFKNFGTVSGAGGRVTIPPDIRTVRGAESEADENAKASQRSKVFEANVAPDIRRIREIMQKTDPGKLTEVVAKWLPGNNQQELVNLLNTANQSYPGVLQSGVDARTAAIIGRDGFNGSLIASMTGPQIQRMLTTIEEKARLDKNIAQRTLKSQNEGAVPGTSNINAPMPSTQPPSGTNKQGWKIKEDKHGNRAYVSPDGKQFEEIK